MRRARLVRDAAGASQCYGFVEFEDEAAAEAFTGRGGGERVGGRGGVRRAGRLAAYRDCSDPHRWFGNALNKFRPPARIAVGTHRAGPGHVARAESPPFSGVPHDSGAVMWRRIATAADVNN